MSISAEGRAGNFARTSLAAPLSRAWRALQSTSAGRITALTPLVAVLAFLSVYPLSMLLYGSLHSTPPEIAGTFNLDGYRDVLSLQSAVTLLNTIGISLA